MYLWIGRKFRIDLPDTKCWYYIILIYILRRWCVVDYNPFVMLIFSSHVLWLDEKYFPFITRQQPSLLLSWQSTSFMLQENNGARESKRGHASIQIYSKMYLWLGWYVFPLSFWSVFRILDGKLFMNKSNINKWVFKT